MADEAAYFEVPDTTGTIPTDEQPRPQPGIIWEDEHDEPAPKARRARSSRSKKVEPLEFADSKAIISAAIAGADKIGSLLSERWASVPRLSGGDEILARYLDALTASDQPEVDRLATALAEAYGENPWLAKLFRSVQKYGKQSAPIAKLVIASVSIFLPRLLYLGVLPNPFGAAPNDGTDMEGGGAHGDRGDDGFGQVGADGVSVGSMPEAVHRPEKQSRQREVPERNNGHESVADIASETRPMGTAAPFHGGA